MRERYGRCLRSSQHGLMCKVLVKLGLALMSDVKTKKSQVSYRNNESSQYLLLSNTFYNI